MNKSPHGIVANVLDCNNIVSKFKLLHSLLDKYPCEKYKFPYPPSYGLNSTTIDLQGCLWNWTTHEGWYSIKQRNQTNQTLNE